MKLNHIKQVYFIRVSVIILLTIITQTLISCAKIGSPSGGAYDKTPPKLKEAKPNPNSTNFKGNEFEIKFDEHIVLANTSEELIISPPLREKPTIKAHLKTLRVTWTDTLFDNTTYIFDFGNSIVDYTEGNKLNNFSYSFSTGPFIDTNEYKGKVIDAYTYKPVANKYVMLYKSESDSVAKFEKPNYLTRTDSSGNYIFRNIATGNYQIFALEDKNQNLLYDLSTEGIAFSNERVESTIYGIDTLTKLPIKANNTLYFFETKDTLINLNSTTILSRYRLQFSFSNPTTDSLQLNFTYPDFKGKEDKNLLLQYSINKDTVDVWSLNQPFDSIKLVIKDIGLEEDIEQHYTKRDKGKTKDTFTFITPNQNQTFFSKLLIEMPFPIEDTTQIIEAYRITPKDTSTIHFKPSVSSPLFLEIVEVLEQGSSQKIRIPQGQIKNRLGQVNDSLVFNLIIDSESDYGNFFITIKDTSSRNSSYILILEDPLGKEIKTKYSESEEKNIFKYLKEGSYKLRMIIDKNHNKKWDHGDYHNRTLPEEIIYFNKTINIRKNWDIEEEWLF